jgi:stress-induced morphogen
MPILKEELEDILQKNFPEAEIEIVDLAGDNDHYSLIIKDKIFNNKNRLESHRIINNILKGKLGLDLHALQIKALPLI